MPSARHDRSPNSIGAAGISMALRFDATRHGAMFYVHPKRRASVVRSMSVRACSASPPARLPTRPMAAAVLHSSSTATGLLRSRQRVYHDPDHPSAIILPVTG
jgi:hypothetical protein